MAGRLSIAVVILIACLWQAGSAFADTVDPVQELAFGTVMMRNNNARHTLTVPPQGAPVYPPAFIQVAPAQAGQYNLLGFLPNTNLVMTVNPTILTLSCVCGGPSFTVDNFVFSPSTPHTDPAGNTQVYMGARLRTSGSRVYYREGAYEGDLQVIVNY